MTDDRKPAPATTAIWAGEQDKDFWQRSTQTPLVRSVSYGYSGLEEWLAVARDEAEGHIYGRNTNPTVAVFERKLAALEGAEGALGFGTGMGAISSALFTFLSPGDRVVSVKDTYGGTNKIFIEFLPRFGIDVKLLNTTDHEAIEAEIAAGCKVVYLETPTNPTLKVIGLARLARAARAVGAVVMVDNTFATPINQNPLELGADLVIHSATKFLGGHADALGGAVCGSLETLKPVYHWREIIGTIIHPEAAYLMIRGMKTLALRVARQNASALELARWLETRPGVEGVNYPGLESNPGHEIAAGQMKGFGGVFSFSVKGGLDGVARVLPRLKYAHMAANLGAVETIAGPPATTSHVECSPEERAAMGIPEGLIRYSVGLEEPEDLKADLAGALAALD